MDRIINSKVDSQMNSLISDLQLLIRQPSVSAKKQGLIECATIVEQLMKKAGIRSEILYLNDRGGEDDNYVPPIVYGEVKSKANPNGKTILFYNHYDVQPEEPVELWEADPFSGKIEGNYIFGRGAADDKGELITRIKAVEYFLKQTGDVPCNVKFIIEGEEEIGSTNLEKYLICYQDRLQGCDGVIWESGIIDEKGRAIIQLGVKGILSVELIAKGPLIDAHSSLAVLIENPAWNLVRALNTVYDNGKILIRDWYKEAKEFTSAELGALANEPFDDQEFKKEYGIDKFANDLKDVEEIKRALAGKPTCNIAGIVSGYSGEGAKTVLPSTAMAKLDFRLVPDMMPRIQFDRLNSHLKEYGFSNNNIELKFLDGVPPFRTPIDHPFVKLVEEAAIELFGTAIISISSAGTGPMYYFDKVLSTNSVCVGGPYKYCRGHSPNEFARIDLLNKTTKCIGSIMEKIGKR